MLKNIDLSSIYEGENLNEDWSNPLSTMTFGLSMFSLVNYNYIVY